MVGLGNSSFNKSKQRKAMFKLIRKLRKDEQAVTVVEYGLIIALIAVAALLAMSALGTSLNEMFFRINSELVKATPS